jgi:glycosyltransferase involved in cell wall biosynthesis
MRILLAHLARFPSSEAPAIQVANVAQAFAELGHDVALVSPAPEDDGVPAATIATVANDQLFGFTPSFRTVTLSRRVHRGQSYLHALRIARLARQGGFDLLFSRNLRACLLPARRGMPTVFEAHTLTSLEGRQDRWVLRQLLRAPGFRGVVAISGGLAEDLTSVLGVPAERILVAHDAVRMETSTPRDPAVLRRPRETSMLRVGYTGSLFRGKGVETLLEAAADCPWAEFHVAGGPAEVADDITRRISAGRAPANVVVYGPIDPAAARTLQRTCDVLVAPFSRRIESDSGVDIARWTSPMKVFEYMASGRPIVISDLPVLREVLRPDVDALMVTPEDPAALIVALGRLRDDPALGARLAASALARARDEFTWAGRAGRILARFAP